MTTSSRSRSGFTLIETAIVVLIVSLGLTAYMALANVYKQKMMMDTTKQRMIDIKSALARFEAKNGRLPCPAIRKDASTAATFGVEACAAGPTDPKQVSGTTPGSKVRIGAVPVTTLGISSDHITDYWGWRYVYAASETLTVAGAPDPELGDITLVNAAGVPVGFGTPYAGHTPYVLFSAGMNGAGAVSYEGKDSSVGCPTSGLEHENCKMTDAKFSDAPYSATTSAATRFTQIMGNSLSATDPAAICGNKGMLYGPGNPKADSNGCLPDLQVTGPGWGNNVVVNGDILAIAAAPKTFPKPDVASAGVTTPTGAPWAFPMIYRSSRTPADGSGPFPFNEYGELILQGVTNGAGYNKGISFVTWDGNYADDPMLRMRVTQDGNVGIGTTAPSDKLTVSGLRPVSISPSNTGGVGYGVNIMGDAGGGWATGYTFTGSSGTALGGFGAVGATDTLQYYYIGVWTGPKVSILANGNVGIGTVTPSARLDVNGNIHSAGDVCTDAAGGKCLSTVSGGGGGGTITGGTCPAGQYVSGISSTGVPACSPLPAASPAPPACPAGQVLTSNGTSMSCVATTSLANSNFGGSYSRANLPPGEGWCYPPNPSPDVANPYTGTLSCPPGFSAYTFSDPYSPPYCGAFEITTCYR